MIVFNDYFNIYIMFNKNNNCFCQDCGYKKYLYNLIGNKFCLHCWKKTNNNYCVNIFETLNIRDSLKLRKKSHGFKKFSIETISGWFNSHLCKEGVNLSRVIDKEKDEYHEVVKDYKTDKIIHESHEKLSDHINHGSAKK